ncbi:MAG: hypothetical protein HW403_105 [Dehalococcoidia bacterium]|nr:hypothetical protein [Dehalococcoidia bacterium]
MMPLVLFLALGVADFGRAFFSLINLSNAAQEGARWGSICQSTTSIETRVSQAAPDLSGITTIIANNGLGDTLQVTASVTYTPITPVIGNLTVAAMGGSITLTQTAEAMVEVVNTSC